MTTTTETATATLRPFESALRRRYEEPWRRYHDWRHPLRMVADLVTAERDGYPVEDPVAAVAFCYWHDAVYDPRAAPGRNETSSAELLAAEAGSSTGVPASSVVTASRMILATTGHRVPAANRDPDLPLLLDLDLAVLGGGREEYREYADAIRDEYAHVEESAYRYARSAVLAGFLDRDRVYLTDWASDRWEERARANLVGEVLSLARAGSPPTGAEER